MLLHLLFSLSQLASSVEIFDFSTEKWEKKPTSGEPPSGLYNNAYTAIGKSSSSVVNYYTEYENNSSTYTDCPRHLNLYKL